eukprot:m.159091 g.159091  ORF g.159091 m.159091 type:complete len:439 (-) comp13363_c3_seq4:3372-4688(-)
MSTSPLVAVKMVILHLLLLVCAVGVVQVVMGVKDVENTRLSPTLPKDMQGKLFFFVMGAHHSGTTLLDLVFCTHHQVSCLVTHKFEDEGQHVQSVYLAASKLGGMEGYAYNPKSHLTEESNLLTDENRDKLFHEWLHYWKHKDRPVYLEKSPPNLIKSRFLQAMFTPQASKFLMVMRHPFGTFRFKLDHHKRKQNKCCQVYCRDYIQHWIFAHELASEDVQFLKHIQFIKYEKFVQGTVEEAKSYIHHIEQFLDLDAGEHVEFYHRKENGEETLVTNEHSSSWDSFSDDDDDKTDDDDNSGGNDDDDDDDGDDDFANDDDDAVVTKKTVKKHERKFLKRKKKGGGKQRRSGRNLLEYHGQHKRQSVEVDMGSAYSWVPLWDKIYNTNKEACDHMITQVEPFLNKFGYSMKYPTWVGAANAFGDIDIVHEYDEYPGGQM